MRVQIKQGTLEGGKKLSVLDGKEFYYFLNIPYAEPPVNDLRFQPPIPAKAWKGVRDATKSGNCCAQFDSRTKKMIGSEDCLYLNVYTPELPNQTRPLKAVMVYIHGGSFLVGSGLKESVSLDYLAKHNVIFVSFCYRLHALGFLNLNIPSCTGNIGLKDQLMVLKWVKENIRSFGGDPESITVVGESAGATCIHHLTISPMAKGLIKRVILQSSTALVPWALIENTEKIAFKLGKIMGYEGTENAEELLIFLKNQPIEKLCAKAQELLEIERTQRADGKIIHLQFLPSIEKISKDAVLPDHPRNLIAKADPIPTICGVDELEGSLALGNYREPETVDQTKENMVNIIKYYLRIDPNKYSEVAAKMNEFYFGDTVAKDTRIRQYINFHSDLFFLALYESCDNVIKSKTPAYFYEFTFAGKFNQSNLQKFYSSSNIGITSACHSDELGYLFYSEKLFPNPVFNDPEKTVIENMCTLWTNFAKTGYPIPKEFESKLGVQWKAFEQDKPSYLKITADLKSIDGSIWNERRQFWLQILKDYALK